MMREKRNYGLILSEVLGVVDEDQILCAKKDKKDLQNFLYEGYSQKVEIKKSSN